MMSTENHTIPTLYEWAGGMPTFLKLTDVFYQKVLADPILEPIFRNMSTDHQVHVAHFIAEVFGGPTQYTERDGGSHASMVKKHFFRDLTEQHRKRWVDLLLQSADEINLPDDPEFRSAFVAYIEWGTRIAMINSNGAPIVMSPTEPMPKWGWGVPGKPYQDKKPEGDKTF